MGTCRFCLSTADMSLFFEDRKVTLNKFLSYTKFKIQKNDGLPEYICLPCIQTLETVVEFMEKCSQTDNSLRGKSTDEKKPIKLFIPKSELMSDLMSFTVDDDDILDSAPTKMEPKVESDDDYKDDFSMDMDDEEDCFFEKTKTPSTIQSVLEKDFFDMSGHLCNICGEQFNYGHQSQFARHLLTHSEPQFKCDECPKAFYVKSSYNTHKKSHSAVKQFPCDYCEKKFFTKGRAFYHMEYIHRKTKTYPCEFCDKIFYRPDYFKKHISVVHKKKQVYQCRSCNETFPYVELLRSHMIIHNGEKTFACRFCETKFTIEREMKEHEAIHISDNPYKCDICSQNFGEKKLLKAHIHSEHNIPYLSPIDAISGDFLQL